MKTQITQNKITVEIPVKGDNRQRAIMARLIKEVSLDAALAYSASFSREVHYRVKDQISAMRRKSFTKHGLDLLAYKEPGKYSKMFDRQFNAASNHSPAHVDLGEWLGVEIECIIPKDFFDNECECGTDEDDSHSHDCPAYNTKSMLSRLTDYMTRQKVRFVSVKGDGSIRPEEGYFAAELTILCKRNDRSNLKRLTELLNHMGARVNKSCGMHVHLDQRDLIGTDGLVNKRAFNKRARNLGKALPMLASMVPASRRENSYCRLIVSARDRYSAVNLTAFRKYKTIEVRLHSATTDFEKINNWIDLLLFISRSEKMVPVNTVSQFAMAFDVPERLLIYMDERVAKFSERTTEEPNVQFQVDMLLVEEYDRLNLLTDELDQHRVGA